MMVGVAPWIAAPPGGMQPALGFGLLAGWDSGWYEAIATHGYDWAPDGHQHAIAFFPLYPLAVRALMATGLPFAPAGALLNGVAFLGALLLVYPWVRARAGESAANWTVAALCWCPLSLFGTVAYTEGLFLLLSGGALRAFEANRPWLAGGLGALASATRVTGVCLAPAFAWAAWRERKGNGAWLAAAAVPLGLLAFIAFNAGAFGAPLAFLHAQAAWRPHPGFDAAGWAQAVGSPGGDAFLKLLLVGGGITLIARSGAAISPAVQAYGLIAFAIVLLAGSPASSDRYAWGNIAVALAFGPWIARRERVGIGLLIVFAVLLASAGLRFARGLWVA